MLKSSLHVLPCTHSYSCSTHLKAKHQNFFLLKKSYHLPPPPDLLEHSGQLTANGQWLRSAYHSQSRNYKFQPLFSTQPASFHTTCQDFVSLEFVFLIKLGPSWPADPQGIRWKRRQNTQTTAKKPHFLRKSR